MSIIGSAAVLSPVVCIAIAKNSFAYSVRMPANGSGNTLQLTIALMPYGEVSPYLFNYVHTGSQLEVRGPLGRGRPPGLALRRERLGACASSR